MQSKLRSRIGTVIQLLDSYDEAKDYRDKLAISTCITAELSEAVVDAQRMSHHNKKCVIDQIKGNIE